MADKRSFLAHLVELDSTYEKIHSLPHLSAFEAAARLGSFSAAADELFSPPARSAATFAARKNSWGSHCFIADTSPCG